MSVVEPAISRQDSSLLPVQPVNLEPRPVAQGESLPQNRYCPLIIVLAAVRAGIALDRAVWPIIPQRFEWWWLLAGVALVAWYFLWRGDRQRAAMAALALSIASIGGAWHHAKWNLFADDDLGHFASLQPAPICLEAIALSAPRESATPPYTPLEPVRPEPVSRLTIAPVAVRNGANWLTVSGRAQLTVPGKLTGVHAGDRLRIFGHIAAPEPVGNPGEFDYAAQDRGNRELSTIQAKHAACVTLVQAGSVWNPRLWIDWLRERGNDLLWSNLSHSQAGLAGAVLLGEREQVDRDTSEAFMVTGAIHILCVAGLHVGIFACFLFWILRSGLVSRRWALVGVMIFTGAYMLVTNAQPPVGAPRYWFGFCAARFGWAAPGWV